MPLPSPPSIWLRGFEIIGSDPRSVAFPDGLVLEKAEHSRIHLLKDAYNRGAVQYFNKENNISLWPSDGQVLCDFQAAFLVKHDWAAAFRSSGLEDATYRLPYQKCAFEFRISGCSVVAIATETGSHTKIGFYLLVEKRATWWLLSGSALDADRSNLADFVLRQIQAISIALEAEVATHEVVRAPAKLNAKRVKAGKEPLIDYRIVDLSGRRRVSNPPDERISTGRGVRLHFRRGHWRHFEAHRTWVKWCLVGNPSLGFVDKDYSL